MKNKILTLDNNFTLLVKGDTNETLVLTNADFIVEVHNKMSDFINFKFTLTDNIDMKEVSRILKAYKLYDMMTGYSTRKQDCITDCELYENIDNKSVKVMDLYCVMLTEYNTVDHSVNVVCDWITYNPESKTSQQVNQFRQNQINEYNDKLNQYNQLLKDLDIDPNESVFSNNFRKSYNKMDWFRPYKI
jgi:hypothetical protein